MKDFKLSPPPPSILLHHPMTTAALSLSFLPMLSSNNVDVTRRMTNSAAAAVRRGGWSKWSRGSLSAKLMMMMMAPLENNNKNKKKKWAADSSNSNYMVPLDYKATSSGLTRPLVEILRDLNKRVPDNIIITNPNPNSSTSIPWYHVNRMLSFYAPGWCGEVRDVIYSDNGTVTVVYRVTIRGSDGEAHRESTATVSSSDGRLDDPVGIAEEMAFCRACARFGFGLYLYHEEEEII